MTLVPGEKENESSIKTMANKNIKPKKILESQSFPRPTSRKREQTKSSGVSKVKQLGRHTEAKQSVKSEKKLSIKSSISKTRVNSGVKRVFISPFNRFAHSFSRLADQNKARKELPYQSINRPTGLSPKEKNYVISTCQSRSTRYMKLKNMATNAIKENKIFTIYGTCNAVRKALLERGWVEKITPNKMNLQKIQNGTFSKRSEVLTELERILLSNLIDKYPPNFVWRTRDEHLNTNDFQKRDTALVNKLKIVAEWTSKQGLCSSIKRNYWFYIENVAEVNGPRTYNSYDCGEIDSFVKDFKITACTSLLKWVLSMVSNDRPVFVDSGRMSMNVVVFALNRCKEYLLRKQNRDIDRSLFTASAGQWNAFLKKYYRIIAKDDVFQPDKDNKLHVYLNYAKLLLNEIHKYRPQLSCEGCHDIWIIKPAYCSRGRGIRMASKLAVITNLLKNANSKYVVQKYIEEPLLIYQTKFDIRQYYLVTSTYPLEIWMYQDCYLKFSSQKYNLKNYHEAIHLTNNAVQRRYKNCTGRHTELPQNNMWDLDQYKNYLEKIGRGNVWDEIVYPGMKKSIIGIMLSCQDTLSMSKNRYELYGCDFILDNEFKPWLIEINSGPDLHHTTPVTAKICPAVISDIIKVVVDRPVDRKCSTGKFECIYRQPITMPKYSSAGELLVRGYALPIDYFYRGKVNIKDSFDDTHITKELNLNNLLKKLKQSYDSDIMIEPEEEDTDDKEIAYGTESEHELCEDATFITKLLDELMERIVSGPKNIIKSSGNIYLFTPSKHKITASHKKIDTVQSLKRIKSLLQKPRDRPTSAPIKKIQTLSATSDNMQQNQNFCDVHSHDKLIKKSSIASSITSKFSKKNKASQARLFSSDFNILEATSKLLSFINDKEKEYFNRSYMKRLDNLILQSK